MLTERDLHHEKFASILTNPPLVVQVVDYVRRILLTGVVAFIWAGTGAQIAVSFFIEAVFYVVSEILRPYKSPQDIWLSRTGHIVVLTSLYIALMDKVDVTDERGADQAWFGGLLVALNVCLIFMWFCNSFLSFRDVMRSWGCWAACSCRCGRPTCHGWFAGVSVSQRISRWFHSTQPTGSESAVFADSVELAPID